MADRYWVGGGSSTNWNATGNTNWASSSGGANNQSVPGTGDNVFFDGNSGTGTTVISASQSIGTLDCTGYLGNITHNASVVLTVDGAGGAFKFVAGMTYTIAASTSTARSIVFTGAGTFNLTSAGKTMPSLQINGASTVVSLVDAYTATTTFQSVLNLTSGQFDANDQNVSFRIYSITGSTARVLTMGNGTWTVTETVGNTTIWDATTVTNLTFTKEGSNIVVSGSVTGGHTMALGTSLSYPPIAISNRNGYDIAFTGTSPTIASLTLTGKMRVVWSATTPTITTAPTWVGSRTAPIEIVQGAAVGTEITMTLSSGTADCDYLILRGMSLAGGTHYAGYHSVNLGGTNSNWTFTAKPNYALAGVSRDSSLAILGSTVTYPMRLTGGVWEQIGPAITSNAGTGAYSHPDRINTATAAIIGHKADTPHKFGITDIELTPA